MKPKFDQMSRAELLVYLKEHRTDDEAWGIFLDQRTPNAKKYPAPLDEESIRIGEDAILQKLQEIERKRLINEN